MIDVNKIEFDKPASNWNEALPVGNGRLGGMVFGNPYIERIQLNGVRFKREVITSFPDNIMAIHLTADKKGSLSFHAQLGRGFAPWEDRPYELLTIRRQNYNHYVDSIKALPGNIQLMEATSGGKGSISSATAIKVIPIGGSSEYRKANR